VQIRLEICNDIFAIQRLQLHTAVSNLPLNLLNQVISNDHLACHQSVLLFLPFAIATALRVSANYVGRRAEIENIADLCWCVFVTERDISPLRNVTKEDANQERATSKRKSGIRG
jgi:hypothetical protein